MRLSRMLVLVTLAVLTVMSFGSASAATESETKSYIGGTGDDLILNDPLATGYDIGGSVFDLDGPISASITIDDMSGAVGGYYEFDNAAGTSLKTGSFCGSVSIGAVPAGSARVAVYVDEALGPLDCETPPGAGTTGTITVTQTT